MFIAKNTSNTIAPWLVWFINIVAARHLSAYRGEANLRHGSEKF